MATYSGTNNIYDLFVGKVGSLDLDSPDLRVLLTTSSYTPSQSTHEFVDDVTNEVSGNGYARVDCANAVWSSSGGANGQYMLDCDNPVWTASGGSIVARYWVLFLWVTADSDSPLIAYGLLDDTPADVTTTDGNTLTLTLPSTGFCTQSRS